MLQDYRFLTKPSYKKSHALVIGINEYKNKKVRTLDYAVNDAKEIEQVLIENLSFEKENIVCLVDQEAIKKKILSAFMRYSEDDIEIDDRLFVFFAGHGHTISGNRGETGFLVPHDADINDLSTLIRWDDFTRNSELIRAKHIFFVMDACYSGLILTRNTQPGSARFLNDMLRRYSRQVLTAGKADEPVADSGGPLPSHSIFTGHLIEGIKGKAEPNDGLLTASGLMAYVYNKVATDKNSKQTPHYGHFEGDGDFILKLPLLKKLENPKESDSDRMIVVPFLEETFSTETIKDKVKRAKPLLSSENSSIELHDLMMEEVRNFISMTGEDHFKINEIYTNEELLKRIARYEEISDTLISLTACISHWAKDHHKSIIQKIFSRMTDQIETSNGTVMWINLKWYPLIVTFYASGISAIYSGNYSVLNNIFSTIIESSKYERKERYLVDALDEIILEITRNDTFKRIPEHERFYSPMSEYLFKTLQPKLDDVLFIGKSYERSFDEFEILYALSAATIKIQNNLGAWGHIGRFGWKKRHLNNPFSRIINEANSLKENWEPIKAGMFGGKYEVFKNTSDKFTEFLNGINWS